MASHRISLPIDAFLPRIVDSLSECPNLVLQASPGSGKTTRVPPALLASAAGKGRILVLEPRRLAAKWAAHRVAQEMGSRLGEQVGYQFRFENVSSPRTRLKFLTEGMLMRQMLSDPELKDTSAVVLDEFHERHLHGDLALGYLRWLQMSRRPELRIVVMSATLETESLSRFLGDCPVVTVESRLHPVAIEHLKAPAAKPLEAMVKDAVSSSLARDGDILVFLPGMAEIRRAADALRGLAESRGLDLLALHGELSREEQDAAMLPSRRRKVILATNVAETSLTIEGVTTVIDSGLHRIASHSWWSGVPSLKTRPVSQASAIQRAGRAGRTAPGTCLRLYTRDEFLGRPAFQAPEIRRADLAQTALELKSLGIRDLAEFPWFEAPETKSLEAAESLLYRLGAIDSPKAGALTPLGERMKGIPSHPRLARMLLEAEKSGVLDSAATLAALISEGELESFQALDALESARRLPSGLQGRMKRLEDQMTSSLRRGGAAPDPDQKRLRYSLLCGFPDRIGRRRGEELLLSSGGSAKLPRGQADFLPADGWVIALDLQETQRLGEARATMQARSVVAIEPEWLFDLVPSAVEEKDEVSWDAKAQRISAVSKITYDGLTLSESRNPSPDPLLRARLIAKLALGLELEALVAGRSWSEILLPVRSSLAGQEAASELETFLARLEVLRSQGILKDFDAARFGKLVEGALTDAASLDAVKSVAWSETLSSLLETDEPGIGAKLQRLAPSHFEFPNGKRARIQYSLDQPPWLESPLQFFFGVKNPPAIAGGRIPLTLHLLAPNHRAVQVTSDLPGFWARVYPEIRTQLSRRYPRHSWPEDPTTSAPVKR